MNEIKKTAYQKLKDKIGEEAVFKIRNERNKMYRSHRPEYYLFYEARSRAKKKGMEFDLEPSDIVIPTHCPVYGIEIIHNKGKRFPWDHSPTVDRIDNTKGYTKDNICIISWKANDIKGHATIEELEAVLRYMKKHLN